MITRWTAIATLAVCMATAGRAAEPLDFSAVTPAAVRYRDDAIRVEITESAAARLRHGPATNRARGLPGLTGLSELDREAVALGVVLEREFPDLPPARTGGIDLSRHWIARLPASLARERAQSALALAPEVASTGSIAIVPVVRVPADSMWASSYHWFQESRRDVHAVEAWDLTVGDPSAPVAVLDTGVLSWHPDLGGTGAPNNGNLWINPLEYSGVPGFDDDGNGYIDDWRGWDFVDLPAESLVWQGEDWRDEDNDPNDYAGHGTAVAGVASAIGNNGIGVTGGAWRSGVLALRVGWSGAFAASGEVDLSYAARAIVYAALAGCAAINMSFATVGQTDFDLAMTVATRLGSTLVIAAGNNGSAHFAGFRSDVVSVAATDADDVVARFSNRGDYVDIAAPGQFIATASLFKVFGADSVALRQPDYTRGASGTSFAAPVAAAAVSLLQSWRREQGLAWLSPRDVLMRLVDTADDIADANPGTVGFGSGRINFHRLLADPQTSFSLTERMVARGAPALLATRSGAVRIAMATTDRRLLILDGATGTVVRSTTLTDDPAGGVAVADLGGNGGAGIFVSLASGHIAGFDESCRPLPGWPVVATLSDDLAPGLAALGDVDGDGRIDVVWGGRDGHAYVWRSDGTAFPGFPMRLSTPGDNLRVALADLDGVPGVEIVAATWGGGIHVVRADGTSLAGWPKPTEPQPLAPVVTRLGHDPEPRILVAAGRSLRAFRRDGSQLWHRGVPGFCSGSLAVGDLDGDRSVEIVVNVIPPRQIVVLDSAGVSDWLQPTPSLGGNPDAPLVPVTFTRADGRGVVLAAAGMVNAWDHQGVAVPGFPRNGSGVPAVLDLDGDGHAEIVVAGNADSVAVIYDAGAGSWSASGMNWLTDRGNPARTGSAIGDSNVPAFDDLAPLAIADLTATLAEGAARLSWTAPYDPGSSSGRPERYELRIAEQPIGESDFGKAIPVSVPAPQAAGSVQVAITGRLEEDRTWWFALRSVDRAGNVSPLANGVSLAVPPVVPATIGDLEIASFTDTSLVLRWTATGDDGVIGRPRRYLIHIEELAFASTPGPATTREIEHEATQDAGGVEVAVVPGVVSGRRYWITVQAEDEGGRLSAASNTVTARAGPLGRSTGFAVKPAAQPMRPPVALHWQLGTMQPGRPVTLDIVDISGRRMRTMTLGREGEGIAVWDGMDGNGRRVANGVYFARLAAGPRDKSVRLVVLW